MTQTSLIIQPTHLQVQGLKHVVKLQGLGGKKKKNPGNTYRKSQRWKITFFLGSGREKLGRVGGKEGFRVKCSVSEGTVKECLSNVYNYTGIFP